MPSSPLNDRRPRTTEGQTQTLKGRFVIGSSDVLLPSTLPARILTKTLSQCLGVSPQTLRAWVKLKKLPAPTKLSHRTQLWDVAAVRLALSRMAQEGSRG
jgi:hypothetical protein